MENRKGKFITFEGPEGSGKSTQIKLLAEHLSSRDYKIELLREPGGTEIGEKIRAILLDVKFDRMSPFCELYLYLAARAQLIEEKIIPFLNAGKVVFCDRFIDATIAYQVCGSGVAPDFVDGFQKFVAAGLTPHLTILLDVDVEIGLKRAASSHPQDRLEKKDIIYHQRVRRGYLELAKKDPKRIKVVSSLASMEDVQKRIRELVADVFK